jgi:hypothetical protein
MLFRYYLLWEILMIKVDPFNGLEPGSAGINGWPEGESIREGDSGLNIDPDGDMVARRPIFRQRSTETNLNFG